MKRSFVSFTNQEDVEICLKSNQLTADQHRLEFNLV